MSRIGWVSSGPSSSVSSASLSAAGSVRTAVAPGGSDRRPLGRGQGLHQPVEDRQLVVLVEHHHGFAGTHPAGDSRRKARFAETGHAVNQHPGGAVAKGSEHRLRLAPAPDEFGALGDRDLAARLVEELILVGVGGRFPLRLARRGQRAPALRAEIKPRQMPVAPLRRIGQPGLAQRLPRPGRRQGDAVARRQPAVADLGEGHGVGVVDRTIPAEHVRHPRPRELPHEGLEPALLGAGLLGGPTG